MDEQGKNQERYVYCITYIQTFAGGCLCFAESKLIFLLAIYSTVIEILALWLNSFIALGL
jgi:hypothetical protein